MRHHREWQWTHRSTLRAAVWLAVGLGWITHSARSVHAQHVSGSHRDSGIRIARQEPVPSSSVPSSSQLEFLRGLLQRDNWGGGRNSGSMLSMPPGFGSQQNSSVPPAAPDGDDSRYRIPLGGNRLPPEIELQAQNGRVTLTARNAPLRELLENLAEAGQFNYVFTGASDALVSISLVDMPVERALSTILAPTGHEWTNRDGIVYVTSLNSGERLPAHVQGRVLEMFELDFASAEDVDLVVKEMLSPVGRSFIQQSNVADNRRSRDILIVEDVPDSMIRIAQFIDQMDVPPRQVLIQAHVLECDLDENDRHGVNLDHIMRFGRHSVRIGVVGMANVNVPQAFTATIEAGTTGSFIELLKTTTDAKTLAAPRVMVINGQEASIQVGEQLGFRVTTTTETSTLESVEFLDVGVLLRVTPRISRDGRVLMEVRPEVSSGDVNPDTGLPEQETSNLDTDVLLHDGQGMVVGGLIQERFSNQQAKTHFLGDIFLIGNLFRRRELDKVRSEIIFVLVPRVVPANLPVVPEEIPAMQRAMTPVLHDALVVYPRPFEARLPDATTNPLYRLPAVGPLNVNPYPSVPAFPGGYLPEATVPNIYGNGPVYVTEPEFEDESDDDPKPQRIEPVDPHEVYHLHENHRPISRQRITNEGNDPLPIFRIPSEPTPLQYQLESSRR